MSAEKNNLLDKIKLVIQENKNDQLPDAIYKLMQEAMIDFGTRLLLNDSRQTIIQRFSHYARYYNPLRKIKTGNSVTK
jgi:hypothetical protein